MRWQVESDLTDRELETLVESLIGDRYWDGDYEIEVHPIKIQAIGDFESSIREFVEEYGE
jgi:hypothetical protein